ncbi:MAG: hypothetical protein WCK59_03980 [Candidatus Falkowbacteria bacterium]
METNEPDNPDLIKNKADLPRPVVMLLLDSWGVAPYQPGNVFFNLKLKNFSALTKNYPTALLSSGNQDLGARYQSLGAFGQLTKQLADAGFSQLNLTESEKLILSWHHFNGGRDKLLNKEDLKVISSKTGKRIEDPEQVTSEIVQIALRDIKKGLHDFLIINLASLDLVSARGDLESAQSAAKVLDKNLGKIVSAVLKNQGLLIITAAYGHAEAMINAATELPEFGINNNPVPFIVVGREYQGKNIGFPETLGSDLSLVPPIGTLDDVPPTILKILNITPPSNLAGKSFF